jgi:hypothetical protein
MPTPSIMIWPNFMLYSGFAAAASDSHLDLLVPGEDLMLCGMEMFVKRATFADTFSLQILDDAEGTLSGIPYSVLITPVTQCSGICPCINWVPNKVLGGQTLRIIYTNAGRSAVSVTANYHAYTVRGVDPQSADISDAHTKNIT